LVPFFRVFEDYYFVGRIVATALTTVTSVFLFLLFRDRAKSNGFALGVVLLFLNSIQVMRLGSSLMSEPLSFVLVTFCLLAASATLTGDGKARRDWLFLFVGGASGLYLVNRAEGLALVAAICCFLIFRQRRWQTLALYLLSTSLSFAAIRSFVPPQDVDTSHALSVFGVFESKSASELAWYPLLTLRSNALLALESVFGQAHPAMALIWLFLVAGVVYQMRGSAVGKVVKGFVGDPSRMWLLLYPLCVLLWPFFSPRYWPLWTVLAIGYSLSGLPQRMRTAALLMLLVIQSPSAWKEYRLAPLASRFQEEIYLPYYRSLSGLRRVMTLNYSRVETLAFVPTAEPIQRTDFQSIPIAMAHLGCDAVEWEVRKRHLVGYDGTEARSFPPGTIESLRASQLFELHRACAFSETYRLLADPEALKAAGLLYSQAVQTPDLGQRLALLEQALSLVYDLPETRLARARTLLEIDPNDEGAEAEIQSVYAQYPSLFNH